MNFVYQSQKVAAIQKGELLVELYNKANSLNLFNKYPENRAILEEIQRNRLLGNTYWTTSDWYISTCNSAINKLQVTILKDEGVQTANKIKIQADYPSDHLRFTWQTASNWYKLHWQIVAILEKDYYVCDNEIKNAVADAVQRDLKLFHFKWIEVGINSNIQIKYEYMDSLKNTIKGHLDGYYQNNPHKKPLPYIPPVIKKNIWSNIQTLIFTRLHAAKMQSQYNHINPIILNELYNQFYQLNISINDEGIYKIDPTKMDLFYQIVDVHIPENNKKFFLLSQMVNDVWKGLNISMYDQRCKNVLGKLEKTYVNWSYYADLVHGIYYIKADKKDEFNNFLKTLL